MFNILGLNKDEKELLVTLLESHLEICADQTFDSAKISRDDFSVSLNNYADAVSLIEKVSNATSTNN